MKNKGVATVEACFVIPLFLFFMLSVLYLYMVLFVDAHIHQGLAEAAGALSQKAYLEEVLSRKSNSKIATNEIVNTAFINTEFSKFFGEDPFVEKVIVGGKKGIVITTKQDSDNPKIFWAKARYFVTVSIPLLGKWNFYRENQIKQKNFVGYSKEESYSQQDEYVYITPEQSVFHTKRSCTHLMLHYDAISGKKSHLYVPCHFCGRKKGEDATIYVSKTSNVFHNNKLCSGLKRTIFRVKKKEVSGLGVCSRCGK